LLEGLPPLNNPEAAGIRDTAVEILFEQISLRDAQFGDNAAWQAARQKIISAASEQLGAVDEATLLSNRGGVLNGSKGFVSNMLAKEWKVPIGARIKPPLEGPTVPGETVDAYGRRHAPEPVYAVGGKGEAQPWHKQPPTKVLKKKPRR